MRFEQRRELISREKFSWRTRHATLRSTPTKIEGNFPVLSGNSPTYPLPMTSEGKQSTQVGLRLSDYLRPIFHRRQVHQWPFEQAPIRRWKCIVLSNRTKL